MWSTFRFDRIESALRRLEVVFLDDALVGLALALDSILELALPLRQQRRDFVQTRDYIAQANEPDHAPDRKAVAGGWILMNLFHVMPDVVHSLPHALQRQSCSIRLGSR